MNRSNPTRPALDQELQRWQRQSESKIPPGAPHPRIHELPGLAAENKAAATPTIDEAVPLTYSDVASPPAADEATQGDEAPKPPERGLVEEAVLERFEDDGGPADGVISGTQPSPETAERDDH